MSTLSSQGGAFLLHRPVLHWSLPSPLASAPFYPHQVQPPNFLLTVLGLLIKIFVFP